MLNEYVEAVQSNPASGLNQIIMSGWVTNKFEGRSFVKLTVAVSNKAGKKNYPVVYAFKDSDGHTPIDDYMLHDYISFIGHISADHKAQGEQMSGNSQQLVIDKVRRPTKRKNRYLDMNTVHLKGTVTNIRKSESVTNIEIDTVTSEGIHNLIDVVSFGTQSDKLAVNDGCEVIAYIRTKRKVFENTNRRPIHYQDIVLNVAKVGIEQTEFDDDASLEAFGL